MGLLAAYRRLLCFVYLEYFALLCTTGPPGVVLCIIFVVSVLYYQCYDVAFRLLVVTLCLHYLYPRVVPTLLYAGPDPVYCDRVTRRNAIGTPLFVERTDYFLLLIYHL